MLSNETISKKIRNIALLYPLKRISIFGSYADGTQTSDSDIDFLVEFSTPGVSLIMLADLKNKLEDELMIPVDIVHYPLPEGAFISINEVVTVYGE